jgi:hypothetical protein
LICLSAEEIATGEQYDARDIQRFKEIDGYTNMFIEHGQNTSVFDKDRALNTFHVCMTWRMKNQIHGNNVRRRIERNNRDEMHDRST